jgi:formyl-CoA transferase
MTPILGKELEGITVVSLEQAVAAPYCGLLLADAGARVIKIERTEGDFARSYDHAANGESAYFVWLNAGKESICLDIDRSEDAALLHRMLGYADVFLHNLAPGSLEKRGFGGNDLRKGNPGLVTCEITGYGRTGPYSDMKAYDLLVQAESGLCSITGDAASPARVGFSVCDIATGLTAFSAILRALLLRARTGKGVDLSIAMFDVLADWMNVPLAFQRYLGKAPPRIGVAHATLAPYGAYQAAGGDLLLIAVQSNREFAVLCDKILEQPELAGDPRFATNMARVENRIALDAIIDDVFARFPRPTLIGKLKQARIACSNLNSVEDLSNHPHLRDRLVELSGTEVRLADLPVPGAGRRHIPSLDENGPALRAEFAEPASAAGE